MPAFVSWDDVRSTPGLLRVCSLRIPSRRASTGFRIGQHPLVHAPTGRNNRERATVG